MLRVYDSHASFLSSTGSRRPCSGAVYISIWHSEVRSLVMCRTTKVAPVNRPAHLFPGVLVPDVLCVFPYPDTAPLILRSMRRLEQDSYWTLFDPVDVPGLNSVFGAEFDSLYEEYESSAVPKTRVSASLLFRVICDSQRESGTPFIIFRDSANGTCIVSSRFGYSFR